MSIVHQVINWEKYGPVGNAQARWEEAGLVSRAEALKVQEMRLGKGSARALWLRPLALQLVHACCCPPE